MDESTWRSLLLQHHNLVVSYVSGALQSWTDAAVAADFFCCFFGEIMKVGDRFRPGHFTRGWDDDKASDTFAAA